MPCAGVRGARARTSRDWCLWEGGASWCVRPHTARCLVADMSSGKGKALLPERSRRPNLPHTVSDMGGFFRSFQIPVRACCTRVPVTMPSLMCLLPPCSSIHSTPTAGRTGRVREHQAGWPIPQHIGTMAPRSPSFPPPTRRSPNLPDGAPIAIANPPRIVSIGPVLRANIPRCPPRRGLIEAGRGRGGLLGLPSNFRLD